MIRRFTMAYRQNTGNVYEDIMSLLTGTNFLGPITRAISAEPNSQLSIGYSIKAKNLLVMGKLSSGRGETAGPGRLWPGLIGL